MRTVARSSRDPARTAPPSATTGDLLADSDCRRLPDEICRSKPGAEKLVAAMADLIAENERHLLATEQLRRRFDDLSRAATWLNSLGSDVVPDDLIRRRLFSDPPA